MSSEKINSRISGFYKMSLEERQKTIQKLCKNLSTEDMEYLSSSTHILEKAGHGSPIERAPEINELIINFIKS